ncbi:spore germination protein GerPC [Aureibacillus halotolerans]|uniref:Spore germination protein PC n=1 Tax=Aureibacillus halotolerans TaxID=1508390 RepID=A0A4V3D617_9BACI|nr:spore germination protein GerPC [Aureibacillus halotolerans]TDQ42077.1 spore germination protein PC [Aureibacillus halotolerans]
MQQLPWMQRMQQLEAQQFQNTKDIHRMKRQIEELQSSIEQLQKTPTTHIDKIEYKFDQLKIETLSGALSIGISPQDFEDLDVSSPDPYRQRQPLQASQSTEPYKQHQAIHQQTIDMLKKDGPSIIADLRQKLGIADDPEITRHMIQDVSAQMPTRIEYYIHQLQAEQAELSDEQLLEEVNERVRRDVRSAFDLFLRHLPKQKEDEEE